MANSTNRPDVTVALLGNPNTGKTTLFNNLAGERQRVGNYPGVTVDHRLGSFTHQGQSVTLVDLPGTYSLAPQSADEMVTVDVLLGRRGNLPAPDVILCIVDAANLDRNLYLVSQALELGLPVVIALNKVDVARERGVMVDVAELARRLDLPVIATEAHRRLGTAELRQALVDAATGGAPSRRVQFPAPFQQEVRQLQQWLEDHLSTDCPEYLVERLLLDSTRSLERVGGWHRVPQLGARLVAARQRLAAAGCPVPAIETAARYAWVDETLVGLIGQPDQPTRSISDRLDRVLTSNVAGLTIFLLVMAIVFQAIFSWSAPLNRALEWLTSQVGTQVAGWLPAGMLRSLTVDGVIAGVGAVLAFLPQIAMLFLFIALLEDCGYMARAAYLMDGLMSRVGLSGKSFIPLLSCFACAVPGIMATRVIESRRDRLVTILVAPLMSCSARLPVYTLLIGAFVPQRALLGRWLGVQGLTMLGLYGLGIVAAVVVALVLKRTLLRGETPPFVLELPDYRLPAPRIVIHRVAQQCWSFIRNAGTLILAMTVLVWAAGYFPRPADLEREIRARYAQPLAELDARLQQLPPPGPDSPTDRATREQRAQLRDRRAALEAEIDSRVAGAYMEQSILGRLGKLIAPVVRPLGWDWRIGCAVLASFPAREMVIGAMGVIYNLGEGHDERSVPLAQRLQEVTWPDSGRPVFTLPVALSLLVFFALCAQCMATLIIIARETGKIRWAAFTFLYMTGLAYAAALLTYQVANALA